MWFIMSVVPCVIVYVMLKNACFTCMPFMRTQKRVHTLWLKTRKIKHFYVFLSKFVRCAAAAKKSRIYSDFHRRLRVRPIIDPGLKKLSKSKRLGTLFSSRQI